MMNATDYPGFRNKRKSHQIVLKLLENHYQSIFVTTTNFQIYWPIRYVFMTNVKNATDYSGRRYNRKSNQIALKLLEIHYHGIFVLIENFQRFLANQISFYDKC